MRGSLQEAGDQALKGGEGPKPDPGLKMSGTRGRTGRVPAPQDRPSPRLEGRLMGPVPTSDA